MKCRDFVVRIELENDAFADGQESGEVARILRELARDIDAKQELPDNASLFDANGNRCGRTKIED